MLIRLCDQSRIGFSRFTFFLNMSLFVLILITISIRSSSQAANGSKNRAKVVENYVLSAKFDNHLDLPQLRGNYVTTGTGYLKPEEINEAFDGRNPFAPVPSHTYEVREEVPVHYDSTNTLSERDLMVHHHHVAPPPPAPPIPPPPLVVNYTPAFLAVGLITFLILLNALQTSLFFMMKPNSLLGGLTNALGRRRRSLPSEVSEKSLESLFTTRRHRK